jgi:3',5'-cyclic AMP phosphodiesterase CpdA
LFLSNAGIGQPTPGPAPASLSVQIDKQNPWNNLQLNNAPDTFRFAIVSDRTGGPRAGVFERAVEQLNWLQPEFVITVGDLINGGAKTNQAMLDKQWAEFNGFIKKLEVPFFYLPGNHDIGSKLAEKHWEGQFGRRYYHFVYKNVLFLMLNTEDPPGEGKIVRIGNEQLAWAKKTLADNANVRWTFVFLHRPMWNGRNGDMKNWKEVETALDGRKHTVFAGHEHIYERYDKNGQKYYVLATTGGVSRLRGPPLGEFDHIVWITMKDRPIMANLMQEGIYPADVKAYRAPLAGKN